MSILFFSIVVLFGSMTSASHDSELICRTICIHDGDEDGVIHNGKCGCWNERDTSKVILRLNSNQKTNKQPVKAWYEQ